MLREDNRGLRDDMTLRFTEMNSRFELVEGTLRDLAQQLVMFARGIKVALERQRPLASNFAASGAW